MVSSWLQGRGEMNGTYLVALLFLLVLVGLRSLLRPDLLPEFLEAGFLLLLGQWFDLLILNQKTMLATICIKCL